MNNLIKFISNFKKHYPFSSISLGICTTSINANKSKDPYISFPREYRKNDYYFHCVIFNSDEAIFLVEKIKSFVKKFYIDIEHKNNNFDWEKIVKACKIKDFFPIQPNKITVNGLMTNFLSLQREKRILVLGSGFLSFSLCSELDNTKKNFRWFVDEKRKSISIKKMTLLFPKKRQPYKLSKFDYIINTIPVDIDIDYNSFVSNNSLFIEVSGASLDFLNYINCETIRFDVSPFLKESILSSKKNMPNRNSYGRRKFNDNFICSGGYLGNKGDIVVDNFKEPKFIIGISDGNGGFTKRYNILFNEYFKINNF